MTSIAVYFEQGRNRVFACALDWPGWCRRDKIIEHVAAAGFSYARKLGVRHRSAPGDPAAVEDMRAGVLAVLAAPSDGTPLTAKGWPARYGARRFAWHALDYAWEIEDRSGPSAG